MENITNKKNKLLLISWILGLLYVIYLIIHFSSSFISSNDAMEAVGVGLATMIIAPHLFIVILALIFNIIGWSMNLRWAALVSGILYAVSILTFALYAIFVIAQMILCFIAFAKMPKTIKQ